MGRLKPFRSWGTLHPRDADGESLRNTEANLAFARPLLAGLESPRMGGGGGGGPVSDAGKPYRGNLGRDVILVTSLGPRGVRGFRRGGFPGIAQGTRVGKEVVWGCSASSPRPVCPTGSTRSRVRPASAPAGAMGRNGRHCCCSPPARARLEPSCGQPPAAGPRVTLAASGSLARARGHVEEPIVQ